MAIDLKAKPFCLDDGQVAWVRKTQSDMTLEEKLGQLFCPIVMSDDAEQLKGLVETYRVGGVLYREGAAADISRNHAILQKYSRVPLLTASNLEQGGTGSAEEGTYFAKQLAVGATRNRENARRLGRVACSEGAAVGVNWAFAPVVDVDMNHHNPITNIRTYGDNADLVLEMASAWLEGAGGTGVLPCIKHFPGDGVDERDQHLVTSVNSLGVEEWNESFGRVYRGLIEQGAPTVMAAHISQPAWAKRLGAGEQAGLPATLSQPLLQGLLRQELGFNGLIVTDATPMVGFCSAMPRHLAVPAAIEAGCDMFLFNKDLDEDYTYMRQGYEQGLLSAERLEDAVTRILATKALAGLHEKHQRGELQSPAGDFGVLGCAEHVEWARQNADEAVTLVRDTQGMLPLSPEKHRRVLLEILGDFDSNARVCAQVTELLQAAGFVVTLYQPEAFGKPLDNVEAFKTKYDAVLYIANVDNASNRTTTRLNWYTFFGQGNNIPWFVREVPTAMLSVGNPYHLLDAPMVQTFVNAYCNSPYLIEAALDKLLGKSTFKGKSPVDATCGLEYLQ